MLSRGTGRPSIAARAMVRAPRCRGGSRSCLSYGFPGPGFPRLAGVVSTEETGFAGLKNLRGVWYLCKKQATNPRMLVPTTLNDPALREKLAGIKLLVFDVDGVLTDGRAYYDARGMAMKAFSMRDGFGFVMARFAGIELAALTGNVAEMVRRRLEAFKIDKIRGGHFRKTNYFQEILEEVGVDASEAAYVGDDLFDIPVLRMAGLSVAPADAHPDVREAADAVTELKGGFGVVRELVEAMVKARGKWDEVLAEIEQDESGGRG